MLTSPRLFSGGNGAPRDDNVLNRVADRLEQRHLVVASAAIGPINDLSEFQRDTLPLQLSGVDGDDEVSRFGKNRVNGVDDDRCAPALFPLESLASRE